MTKTESTPPPGPATKALPHNRAKARLRSIRAERDRLWEINKELVKALEGLLEYCHHHEGWQDDHPERITAAEIALKKARTMTEMPEKEMTTQLKHAAPGNLMLIADNIIHDATLIIGPPNTEPAAKLALEMLNTAARLIQAATMMPAPTFSLLPQEEKL